LSFRKATAVPFRTVLTPEALNVRRAASFAMSDVAMNKPWRQLGITDEAGRVATAHGWRSTFRTWIEENYPQWREEAEHQLAHVVGGKVVRAYARSDLLDQRRKVLEAWEAYLTGKRV
jgi:integrase